MDGVLHKDPPAQTDSHRQALGFLSAGDGREIATWSGTPYFMAQALAPHFSDVVHLGPIAPLFSKMSAAAGHLAHAVTGQTYLRHANPFAYHVNRLSARARVRGAAPAIVFAPAGSSLIGGVPKGVSVVYCTDATFRLMVDYYPEFSKLSRTTLRTGERLEAEAIARSDVLVYSSAWAARSAIEDYGADPGRVHVIPFGANLTDPPHRRDLKRAADVGTGKGGAVLRLLFVGKQWQRKGGDLALAAMQSLRQRGYNARLTVLGCQPPLDTPVEGLDVAGFLDKSDPEQNRRFAQYFLDADLYLMPVRAECSAIAFCEAAAYGLPVISCDTGGTGTVVQAGRSGLLLPPGSDGIAYADLIERAVADPGLMVRLREGARRRYEEVLNWPAWGLGVANAVRAHLGSG
ncbi:MAG: glycosyltransferase family 4 protein [Pseudomonadota bacterium]